MEIKRFDWLKIGISRAQTVVMFDGGLPNRLDRMKKVGAHRPTKMPNRSACPGSEFL